MGKLDFAHLSAGELDDQALTEIRALLSSSVGQAPLASLLISTAAAGQLVVARRPCGMLPEIVGVAARLASHAEGDVVVAVEPAEESGLAAELRLALSASAGAASLFRRRDRAPLGLTSA